jgi:hypothetical protein
MRRTVVMVGLALLVANGGGAMAQAVSDNIAVAEGFPLPLGLPTPADTGKPSLFVPPPTVTPPAGCDAAFGCGMRVIGTIQRNGAVELNTSILRW